MITLSLISKLELTKTTKFRTEETQTIKTTQRKECKPELSDTNRCGLRNIGLDCLNKVVVD